MESKPLGSSRLIEVDFDPFAGGELTVTVPSTEPQREIWTAVQMGEDASCAFNESVSVHLQGELHEAPLTQALRDLLARHESLRATFSADGLSMCVAASPPFELDRVDLSAGSAQERDAGLRAVQREEVTTPFGLERGPLFRARLIRLTPQDHVLTLSAHHIVFDGWSMAVVVRELGELYTARKAGHEPTLSPAPLFSDYARAERAHAATAAHAADERFWRSSFEGSVPVLELPADRSRPPMRTFSSAREDHRLEPALVERLKKAGARAGASFFTTLLAGFGALLHRLTGQDDLVMGIPAAGQSVTGLDGLVGHCVNTLPLRTQPDGDRPFTEYLKMVRGVMLDGYEHQRYTLGELLKQLPLPRDASRLPVVSVLFNVDQAVAGSSLRFEGLTGRVSTNPRAFESFEIFINAAESRGQVVLETQYNADLFEGDTIRRWLSAFEQLLEGVAADPSTALSRLPLLNAEERARVLGWNDTAMPFDRAASVHELFERQVARAPDAIAVTHVTAAGKGVELTYAELNRRANQVARRLRGMGVAPAGLVGLCVERSPELLVGMLAILKTGAAYIPLDPGFPRDRLTFMVADSKLEVVVSTSNLVELVAERLGGPAVLALDTDAEAIAGEDGANLEPLGAPETSAYVIYTSGSTGKPKGVMVPHRAVVNFLEVMRRTPGMSGADTVLAVTTLSFDIAVLELHLPFSVGARVVLASRDVAQDGGLLLAALEREGATVMQATPSTWRLLIAAGWEGKRPLKVLCGGEALPKDLASELARRAPDCWNMYGPTETTVWSTCWRIQRPVHRVSIGRPIGNTQVYLLDAHLQPVPVGVPGELHIGGEGVTLGYLNRPELTAERFVPDPFSPAPGARLYKTGDLARYLPDGNIEYLRRNDTQVKVRGYRIELGEIESALSTHPAVKQASVIVREDRPGDVRLVGYLVPHGRLAAAPDEASLRSHLKVTLPDYMVPQHFVAIEALPLTPNGKIDRKALPAPDVQDSAAGEHVEARTDTERALAKIWQDVLGLDRVGVTANFFSLGGHSLLAAQVVSRVSRDLGVVVPLRKLFEAPTIEQLARASSPDGAGPSAAQDASAPPKKAVRIPRRSELSKPAPVSPMQQRMWLFDVMDPGNPVYNLPAAFRIKGPLDIPALRRALNEIFRRHEATRTTLQWQGDEPVQVIAPSLTLPLEPIDMRAMPAPQREAELLKQMRAAANTSFDISTGPLVRAELYLLDENENALFFMPHHAVWDGWSFDIFLSELATLYDAFHRGLPSPLAELPVSYADFSTWHREWLQGEELERQSVYWRKQLAGELGVLELPTDHPRPPQFNYRGATEPFVLTKAEIDAITALGRSQGATLYMVLLSAFKTLLFRYTGQEDILVGTPVRGRSMPEVEDVIGFFVNALVLRTEVKPELTFRELLGRVRGVVLDAFSHQDMPFELLLQELNVQRDPSRTPIYQAFFTFQDVSNRGNTLGDEISYGQIHVHAAATQTDILFWVKETGSGLVGGIDYSTDLFEQATIVRMLKQLRTLLRAVTQDINVELGAVQILPEAERQQLQAWNDTALEYPRSLCAHELIEAQVRRTPDAPRAEARSDAERLVAEIWQHALQVKQVGAHDNFFDLGGHSLLSLQVTAEIERRTGVRLSPRVLLLNSLEQVAALLPAATAPVAATPVAAAAPEPVGGGAGSPTIALAPSSWIPPVARPLVDRVLGAEPSWVPSAARPLLQQMRTWLGVPEASPVEPERRAEFEPRTVTADTGAPQEPTASDRIPLFFGRPERQIFAVHHLPAVAIERTTAILLCAPAPQEYMQTHWALRRLAGLLAKEGFHVLRFDYSCTGDSAGAIEEGELAQWRQDIRDAAGVLKERSGLRKVSVVGMRLGAALAVQAASEGLSVQTLVLWEPVVDGRAYLKELTEYDEVRRTWFLHPPKRSREELMGYRFPDSMRRSLEQVQLLEAPLAPPDRTALVIAEETQSYRAFSARLAREAQGYEYRFVPEKARGATREGALLSNAVLHDIVSVLTSERRTS